MRRIGGMTLRALTITAILVSAGVTFRLCHAASADTVVVSDRDCEAFRPYVEDPSVEYKPGADVHGREVAPADLGGGIDVSPDINIPLTVDVRPWMNLPAATTAQTGGSATTAANPALDGLDGKAAIGTVTVHDNKVYLNGQPLASAQEHAVKQACLDYLRKHHRHDEDHDRDRRDRHDRD